MYYPIQSKKGEKKHGNQLNHFIGDHLVYFSFISTILRKSVETKRHIYPQENLIMVRSNYLVTKRERIWIRDKCLDIIRGNMTGGCLSFFMTQLPPQFYHPGSSRDLFGLNQTKCSRTPGASVATIIFVSRWLLVPRKEWSLECSLLS